MQFPYQPSQSRGLFLVKGVMKPGEPIASLAGKSWSISGTPKTRDGLDARERLRRIIGRQRPVRVGPITITRSETTLMFDLQRDLPVSLPVRSPLLLQAIEASRSMLELGPDWSYDGAVAPNVSTWNRAARLLASAAVAFDEQTEILVPTPVISPASDGSIDIVFRANGKIMGINVPPELDESPVLYGKKSRGDVPAVNAILDDGAGLNSWLIHWLSDGRVDR